MQIFVFDQPLRVALSLDARRFYAQIREAKIILKLCDMVKDGNGKRWINQPLVQMYIDNISWLKAYIKVFECVRIRDIEAANVYNKIALSLTPKWHNDAYYEQMKRRLYTKNPEYYKDWSFLGKSYDNWYWVNGEWKIISQI